MSIFKCKMCGGTIEFNQGDTVGVCDSCGTKQTLPNVNDDAINSLYNRANTLRMKSEFDRAEELYNKIIATDEKQAEAYWGIILCKFGIEYVEDPKTFKRIPTCHRTSFEAITADEDFKLAVKYGDTEQKKIYRAEAKAIDAIQKDILNIAKNEKPFDVFICYKETDEAGKRTQDSVIANDIYHQLTTEGFKVFYAAITLEDKLGQEYEPYIFAALNSAKVMLVVGSKPEYFTSVWVKNEWSRFLKIMKNDRSKLLIPCYKDMDAYELPDDFAHLQAQDMSKIGFINDVVRGIKKVISTETEVKKQPAVVVSTGNATVEPLIKRAFMFLEDGDWTSAKDYCEKVLDLDPEFAPAYVGKLMSELKVRKQEQLADFEKPFDGNSNYQKAVRFGDEVLSNSLKNYIESINKRNEENRIKSIYYDAVVKQENAKTETEYYATAECFKQIIDYKDSKALYEKCLELAEKAKEERLAKEETDKLEAERKAEEKRIATEKLKKKAKKISAIAIPSVGIIIAFMVVLTTVIMPKVKYNQALEFIEIGKYQDASQLLQETKNEEIIDSLLFNKASELFDNGDIKSAQLCLVCVSEKMDKNKREIWNLHQKEIYECAVTLLNNEEYENCLIVAEGILPNEYEHKMDDNYYCAFEKCLEKNDYKTAHKLLNSVRTESNEHSKKLKMLRLIENFDANCIQLASINDYFEYDILKYYSEENQKIINDAKKRLDSIIGCYENDGEYYVIKKSDSIYGTSYSIHFDDLHYDVSKECWISRDGVYPYIIGKDGNDLLTEKGRFFSCNKNELPDIFRDYID